MPTAGENMNNLTLLRARSSSDACAVSKGWYKQYCPFTGMHKTAINDAGYHLTGSHILKAGSKYVALSRFPIAVLPQHEQIHAAFELLAPPDRFIYIVDNVQSNYRDKVRRHLELFVELMVIKGLDPVEFTG